MNEQSTYLIQAIRGPIILITIGVLFAFDRFTEFRFSQTWPILLIVVGLLRLVGGPRLRRRDYPAPGSQYTPPEPASGPSAYNATQYSNSPYTAPPATHPDDKSPEAHP
jgi:hypothetical protein